MEAGCLKIEALVSKILKIPTEVLRRFDSLLLQNILAFLDDFSLSFMDHGTECNYLFCRGGYRERCSALLDNTSRCKK